MAQASADAICCSIAETQFGLIGHVQALAAGLNHSDISFRLRKGRWERVLPRVYRTRGAPRSWHQDAMAASLYAGEESAISHAAAARAHHFNGFEHVAVEVSTTDRKRAHGLGVRVHRCDRFLLREREFIGELPVTSVRRTIMDLAGARHPKAERSLDQSLREGLTSLGQMWLLHDQEWTRGRRGIAIIRCWLKERSPGTAPSDSQMEQDLLRIIRAHGLDEPLAQVPLVLPTGLIRFDLAYPDRRLAIEADGWAYHGDREAFDRDRMRDAEAGTLGWRVLRFTWAQIHFDPGYVVRTIRAHLDLHPPSRVVDDSRLLRVSDHSPLKGLGAFGSAAIAERLE